MNEFNVYNLSEYTTKSALIEILQISSRTLYNYHQIAMLTADFEADYPSLGDEPPNTKASLTKYQCWVIATLILFSFRLSKSNFMTVKAGVRLLKPEIAMMITKQQFNRFYDSIPTSDCTKITIEV